MIRTREDNYLGAESLQLKSVRSLALAENSPEHRKHNAGLAGLLRILFEKMFKVARLQIGIARELLTDGRLRTVTGNDDGLRWQRHHPAPNRVDKLFERAARILPVAYGSPEDRVSREERVVLLAVITTRPRAVPRCVHDGKANLPGNDLVVVAEIAGDLGWTFSLDVEHLVLDRHNPVQPTVGAMQINICPRRFLQLTGGENVVEVRVRDQDALHARRAKASLDLLEIAAGIDDDGEIGSRAGKNGTIALHLSHRKRLSVHGSLLDVCLHQFIGCLGRTRQV